jgi:hypothetical protein
MQYPAAGPCASEWTGVACRVGEGVAGGCDHAGKKGARREVAVRCSSHRRRRRLTGVGVGAGVGRIEGAPLAGKGWTQGAAAVAASETR